MFPIRATFLFLVGVHHPLQTISDHSPRSTGFYRVNYDVRTWKLLTTTLVHGDLSLIHPVNRGQLLYDGFDLALHDFWSFDNALGLTRYLRRETDYLPWFIAVRWLNVLKAHLYKSDCFPLYQVSLARQTHLHR